MRDALPFEYEMHHPVSVRCTTLWVWVGRSKEKGFKGFELLEHWCWLWGGRSCTKLLTSAVHMLDLRLKTCLNVQVVGIHYTVMPMFWMHTRLLTRREGVTRHPHQVVDKEGRCYKASTPSCWQGGKVLQGIHTKLLTGREGVTRHPHQGVDRGGGNGGGGSRGCYKVSKPRCWWGGRGGAVARHPYQVVDKEESCCWGPLTKSQWSSVCAQKQVVSVSVACQWPISGS